ncbi:cell division protein ZapA [Lagierella sp.]|uniref:cell division protein ZapA n=1 Tax=Lagierella sp. TaxID=2849657 RepID=UPI002617EAEA|nr:cell division protein ZapA [Lagierella sp.]
MQNKEKHSITILGKNYKLLSDKSEEEIKSLEELINSQIQNIKKDNNSLSNDMIFTLTLLYFAEDVNRTRAYMKQQESEIIGLKFEKENYKAASSANNERLNEVKTKYDEILKLSNQGKLELNETKAKYDSTLLDLKRVKDENNRLSKENEEMKRKNLDLINKNKGNNSKLQKIIDELIRIKEGN